MRKAFVGSLLVAIAGFAHLAGAQQKETKKAPDAKAFLATWSGTWMGGAGGKFEMKFEKDAKGNLGGSISPTPNDGAAYTVPFKSVVLESGKLTATFEPPDGQAEVTMTATVAGAAGKGEYNVRDKQGTDVETGSWTAKRK